MNKLGLVIECSSASLLRLYLWCAESTQIWRKTIATVVWCSFSSELCSVNSCWGVIGWSQGIRAPARPLWRTCQVHKVAWLHDFHENVILCLWVPGPLQTATERHTQVICILMSLGLPCGRVLWRASRVASPALFVHGSWLKYRERKAACLEMVPTLYFSVVTRDKSSFLFISSWPCQRRLMYHQAGFTPSSSHGKPIFVSKKIHFQPTKVV